MITNNFKIKNFPITKNFPKTLFYKRRVFDSMNPSLAEYIMFSTQKENNSYGIIHLGKTKNYGQWRDDYKKEPILLVHFLQAHPRRKGIGKILIDFAKKYSEQNGCNGYIVLKATSIYENTPHLFYRKQGFSTLDCKTDKKMDMFIKSNKEPTILDFRDMLMHYPPKEEKKTNLFQRFLNLFK